MIEWENALIQTNHQPLYVNIPKLCATKYHLHQEDAIKSTVHLWIISIKHHSSSISLITRWSGETHVLFLCL